MSETRAEWSASYVNDLPDSAFACVDEDGRHYPHHDADGNLDLPHLRNALSRIRQDATTSCGRSHLEAHAEAQGIGDRSAPRYREERVVTVEDLEVRDEGKTPVIIGHPIVYDTWSEDLGGFRERIARGAAAKTILESDIRALFNHDPNYVLGRNRSGTMELTEQAKAVKMKLTPPDTQIIRDLVIEPMRRGDINQMSFAFRVAGPSWNSRDGGKPPHGTGEVWNEDYTEREVLQFRMFDASIVTFPGYTSTDAQVRTQPGLVDGLGMEWERLSATLTRQARGLPLTESDIDLIRSTAAYLSSYLPEPEPPAATTQEAQEAGRRMLDHYTTLLALEAASV